MTVLNGIEQERQGVMEAARLMVVSARTAPKSGGVDDIHTAIVCEDAIEALAMDMEAIATERNIDAWRQQAKGVRKADAIVLIGVKGIKNYITNCGACGFDGCNAFKDAEKKRRQDFEGPNCIFKALDLGVAVGSAVKTASILNIDNRILYRIGAAAKRLNYLPEASIILGIPLSAKGKNIYFDREVQ